MQRNCLIIRKLWKGTISTKEVDIILKISSNSINMIIWPKFATCKTKNLTSMIDKGRTYLWKTRLNGITSYCDIKLKFENSNNK